MLGMRRFWRVTFSVFSHCPLFWTLPYIRTTSVLTRAVRHSPVRVEGADRRERLEKGTRKKTSKEEEEERRRRRRRRRWRTTDRIECEKRPLKKRLEQKAGKLKIKSGDETRSGL
jgi:hypothetical protein